MSYYLVNGGGVSGGIYFKNANQTLKTQAQVELFLKEQDVTSDMKMVTSKMKHISPDYILLPEKATEPSKTIRDRYPNAVVLTIRELFQLLTTKDCLSSSSSSCKPEASEEDEQESEASEEEEEEEEEHAENPKLSKEQKRRREKTEEEQATDSRVVHLYSQKTGDEDAQQRLLASFSFPTVFPWESAVQGAQGVLSDTYFLFDFHKDFQTENERLYLSLPLVGNSLYALSLQDTQGKLLWQQVPDVERVEDLTCSILVSAESVRLLVQWKNQTNESLQQKDVSSSDIRSTSRKKR